jgi:sec-independent protein translocase protein TatA
MFSVPEIAIILVIVLVVFGPGKLPSLGSALGQGLRNLRKAGEEVDNVSEKARQLGKVGGANAQPVDTGTTSTDRPNTEL